MMDSVCVEVEFFGLFRPKKNGFNLRITFARTVSFTCFSFYKYFAPLGLCQSNGHK